MKACLPTRQAGVQTVFIKPITFQNDSKHEMFINRFTIWFCNSPKFLLRKGQPCYGMENHRTLPSNTINYG